MNKELSYSRPRETAQRLGDLAKDRHRFLGKKILLTGEPDILRTTNGRDAFLFSLRLLVRLCPNVSVALLEGQEALLTEAREVAVQVAFGKAVEFRVSVNPAEFDAILSVGTRVDPTLPWTTINSNGWLARVSSGDVTLSEECSLANPVGALAAAALGAGEVFKRLIALVRERGALLNGLTFSVLALAANSNDPGPALRDTIESDLLVAGGGAIGNGIIALLSRLPITGKIDIVDREKFGEENLGTCLLIGPEHITRPKAAVLEAMLKVAGKNAQGFYGSFADYAASLKGKYPAVVLNGLDNIDVRHEVQRTLWPDLIVDGAIGDFGCQVSSHPWAKNVACLICLFRPPVRSAESVAAEASGLAEDRVRHADEPVSNADVESAPEATKDFLRARVGKPICSVVSEAVAQKISQDTRARGFEPSVPFVAAFSACMVVAETVSYLSGWPSALDTRFQFDFLQGPDRGEQYPQERRADCLCQRRKNIDRLRATHGLGG
jgi:molybdopterin/thiamine biosynthesis adenylyltransferase